MPGIVAQLVLEGTAAPSKSTLFGSCETKRILTAIVAMPVEMCALLLRVVTPMLSIRWPLALPVMSRTLQFTF